MDATTNDFWPDLNLETIRTPKSYLEEQAGILGRKTKNLLTGEVVTDTPSDEQFRHTLNLVLPTLDNYTLYLLSVAHGLEQYPVTVHSRQQSRSVLLADEAAFLNWLQSFLSSDYTRRIIQTLLSQIPESRRLKAS